MELRLHNRHCGLRMIHFISENKNNSLQYYVIIFCDIRVNCIRMFAEKFTKIKRAYLKVSHRCYRNAIKYYIAIFKINNHYTNPLSKIIPYFVKLPQKSTQCMHFVLRRVKHFVHVEFTTVFLIFLWIINTM